jgi:hypothetical protein
MNRRDQESTQEFANSIVAHVLSGEPLPEVTPDDAGIIQAIFFKFEENPDVINNLKPPSRIAEAHWRLTDLGELLDRLIDPDINHLSSVQRELSRALNKDHRAKSFYNSRYD